MTDQNGSRMSVSPISNAARRNRNNHGDYSRLLDNEPLQQTSQTKIGGSQSPCSDIAVRRYDSGRSIEENLGSQNIQSTYLADTNTRIKPLLPTPRMNGPRWSQHWKTIGIIVGFLLAAIASAVSHYLLFIKLDGTLPDDGYLTQSQVSAVSLLLVTIFKAMLGGGVGVCFAQHLWDILRGSVMPISLVERWFFLRSNILALGDIRLLKAPVLFLMALFIWCIGIATIYPPGALTVDLEPHTTITNMNTSIMIPPAPKDWNPMLEDEDNQYPALAAMGRPLKGRGTDIQEIRYYYKGPIFPMNYIAKSVIAVNQVFNLPSYPGENSSYQLQFNAPQYVCNSSIINETIPLDYDAKSGDLGAVVFESSWSRPILTISKRNVTGYYSRNVTGEGNETFEAYAVTDSMECRPVSMLYKINVTYPRGAQQIDHSMNDPQPLTYPNLTEYQWTGDHWPWNSTQGAMSLYPQELLSWIRNISEALPLLNHFALLDSLASAMDYEFYQRGLIPLDRNVEWVELDNGTRAAYDTWHGVNESPPYKHAPTSMEGSIFQTDRYNATSNNNDFYDPRTDLILTQQTINTVLTDITISALSLGTWWDMVPVTTVRYRNTYRFSQPLNLILPYSICLGVAALFSVTGIWSLLRNGVSAADGGFLQVMMATRGDTQMERLVLKDGGVPTDVVSQELKNLKIRYGELVLGEGAEEKGKRFGFGTVEETMSLRKRR